MRTTRRMLRERAPSALLTLPDDVIVRIFTEMSARSVAHTVVTCLELWKLAESAVAAAVELLNLPMPEPLGPTDSLTCRLHFLQRLAEHRFMFDRFGHLKGKLKVSFKFEPV